MAANENTPNDRPNICVCGRKTIPLFRKNWLKPEGFFCTHCGGFYPVKPEQMPILWMELGDDSIDEARSLIETHEGRLDMIIREIPPRTKK